MSAEPVRNGRLSALPSMLPGGGDPCMVSSPASQSTPTQRAPAAVNAFMKKPGPLPTSMTIAPARSA